MCAKKKRSLTNSFLKWFVVLVCSIVFLTVLLFLLVKAGIFGALPDKNALSSIRNEEASLVKSEDGQIIGKYFAKNRTNITWKQIPEHLKNALIATEDKRFFNHKGYDKLSYLRVFIKSLLFHKSSGGGGSTLTQQLIKNLYGRSDYGFLSLPVNKFKEIIMASRMEQVYNKEELLLLYLNSVPFGEDVYGVESAAHRYFNKPASELKIEESAVLVGMLKANTYFNPQLNPENSRIRRNLVLGLMKKEHYLSAAVADSLQKLPLKLNYENMSLRVPAGYFVYQVKKKTLALLDSIKINTGKDYNLEKDGLKIYTTLNMQLQQLTTTAIKNHLEVMQKLLDKELENSRAKKLWYKKHKQHAETYEMDTVKRNIMLLTWEGNQNQHISRLDSLWHYYKMLNASVLITNPKNGAVITWVGGNDFTTLPFDMVLSHRQIASAFKPVLYATALEKGITPCTYLENEVNRYSGFEDWEPQNANHTSSPDSSVAFWYALANSMNLPTVDLYFKTGSENLTNICNRLNFPHFNDIAPSNALGTLDLSLYEIVKAYGAFANHGMMNELFMIDKITDAEGHVLYKKGSGEPVNVFSNNTSMQITAILEAVINQGTGVKIRNNYGIHAQLAGKTGTAQNYSNAWFIAYTPEMVMGTWVGASSPEVHFFSGRGSGSSLALPIVAKVIREIERKPELKQKYLTAFNFPQDVYSFLTCDPYHRKGIKGFFRRLFSRKEGKDNKDAEGLEKKDQKKNDVKSFFQRLFNK